jgi:subtilase family serine protease
VQYLMGISPRSPSTYWHSAGIVAWLLDISDTINPPLVQSVSYGAYESLISKGFHASVTTLAIKLGVMGVTLFAATGDDGAVSMDIHLCGYEPNFPAVNPYFTAVGATSVRKRLTTLCATSSIFLILLVGTDRALNVEFQNPSLSLIWAMALLQAVDSPTTTPVPAFKIKLL